MNPKILRISLGSDPLVIDPQLAETGMAVFLANQLTSTLFEVDENLKLYPKDAESYEWQNNGRTLQLILKENLKWSDNKPLTSCHYRDGILRALDPRLLSPYADLFFDISGAESRKKGQIQPEAVQIKCDAQKRTLRLELLRSYSIKTLHAFAFVNSAPARLDLLSKPESSWLVPGPQNLSVSNGPYVVQEWKRDQKIVLKRRENAPKYDQAKISVIEMPIVRDVNTAFILYESNELDILDEIPPSQLQTIKKRSDHHSSPWLTSYMVGFSFVSSIFMKDLNLRKALAFAAHQDEIPLLLPSGETPAFGWIPPSLIPEEFREKNSPFNPTLAKELFLSASKKFKAIKPKLYFNSGERHKLLMERLSHNFKEHLNLELELNPTEWKVLLSKLKHQAPDLYRYAWTAVYPDVLFFLEIFHSQNINNFGRWKNKEYDSLIEFLSQVPLEKRDGTFWKKVARAQEILVREDPALIPIYHYVKNILIKPRVKGLKVSPLGLSALKNAYFE